MQANIVPVPQDNTGNKVDRWDEPRRHRRPANSLVHTHTSARELLVAHDFLDLRFVLLNPELCILLLKVLHGLGQAALALALELPAPRELDAAPAARSLRTLICVLGDVDVRDCELVALLKQAGGDELELI